MLPYYTVFLHCYSLLLLYFGQINVDGKFGNLYSPILIAKAVKAITNLNLQWVNAVSPTKQL